MSRPLAKSPTVVLVPVLIAVILLPITVLLRNRPRFDGSLWLWTGVLVLAIMAISIPLAIWQRNAASAGRFLRPPWPTTSTKPLNAAPDRPTPEDVFLRGSFTWTASEFVRMRKAWLQHTPAGRNHRRMMYGLSAIALAGISAACVWLVQGLLLASALLIASAALLAFVISCRIKVFDEVCSNALASWELIPEGIMLQTGDSRKELRWQSMYAMLRTRDGFLLWPADLHETWLPVRAFGRPEDVELFSELASSQVVNYVHEN